MTRRSILQSGAATALAVGVGVSAASGTAAAHACPRTPGYWMNHDWPSTGLQNVNDRFAPIVGDDTWFDSVAEGQAYLKESKAGGDTGQIMAFHLIAMILNLQNECEDAADATIADVDGDDVDETLREIKGYALNWLQASNFPGPVTSWHVASAPVQDGEPLKDFIDAFNNNELVVCTGCEEDAENGVVGDSNGRPADAGNRGRGN